MDSKLFKREKMEHLWEIKTIRARDPKLDSIYPCRRQSRYNVT